MFVMSVLMAITYTKTDADPTVQTDIMLIIALKSAWNVWINAYYAGLETSAIFASMDICLSIAPSRAKTKDTLTSVPWVTCQALHPISHKSWLQCTFQPALDPLPLEPYLQPTEWCKFVSLCIWCKAPQMVTNNWIISWTHWALFHTQQIQAII